MNYLKLLRFASILVAIIATLGVKTIGAAPAVQQTFQCGKWNLVPSPNPYSLFNYLNAVAIVAPNDVWAVGNGGDSNEYQTLIEHWNGTNWQVVPGPSTQGPLFGVTALATNNVWAVGATEGGLTLIEHWNGSQWSSAQSPSTANQLNGVTALAANDIWAAGYAGNTPLFVHWDGSKWSVVHSPKTSGQMYAISAISSTDVWAVGYDKNYHTLAEHWNGSTWQIVPTPQAYSELLGVTAIATNDVWAVGVLYTKNRYTETLTEHWNGSKWSIVKSPGRSNSTAPQFYGVAASGANDVWSVGYNFNGNGGYETSIPIVARWNGKRWTRFRTPEPGNEDDRPVAVAMASPHDIWLVGSYDNFQGFEQYSMIEYYC